MPCLIFTGHPCAGKSTLAELFRKRALAHSSRSIQNVVIINEESACGDHTKAACYVSSHAEKKTRGALKSAFDRAVSSSSSSSSASSDNSDASSTTLVILDSMNYIKGFRYELHCITKAAKDRHGIVWVLNDADTAMEWNRQRRANNNNNNNGDDDSSSEYYYSDELLQQLIQRYEPPDSRNRWDKPLYRVDVRPQNNNDNNASCKDSGLAGDLLNKSVYNMHSLSDAIGGTAATAATTSGAGDDATTSSSSGATGEAVAATAAAPAKKVAMKRAVFKRAAKPATPTAVAKDNVELKVEPIVQNVPETITTATATLETANVLTLEERIDEILDSFLLDCKPLVEGASTRQHMASDSNVLHNVDSITQQVCTCITAAQNKSASGTGRLLLTVRGETLYFECQRRLALTELRRHRKQYIHWIGTHPSDDTSERAIAESFLRYIEAQR